MPVAAKFEQNIFNSNLEDSDDLLISVSHKKIKPTELEKHLSWKGRSDRKGQLYL